MTNVVLMDSANLKVCGGTKDELEAMSFRVGNRLGATSSSGRTVAKVFKSGNVTKTIYNQKEVKIAIVDNGLSRSEQRHTAIHEMGHALGWDGHSQELTDIMYYAASYIREVVSLNDKAHLEQVY